MKVSTRYKSSKTPCPVCGMHYLQTAYGKENRTFVRVGEYCPGCEYIRRVKKCSDAQDAEHM